MLDPKFDFYIQVCVFVHACMSTRTLFSMCSVCKGRHTYILWYLYELREKFLKSQSVLPQQDLRIRLGQSDLDDRCLHFLSYL